MLTRGCEGPTLASQGSAAFYRCGRWAVAGQSPREPAQHLPKIATSPQASGRSLNSRLLYESRTRKWPSCNSAIKVALGYTPCGFGIVVTGVSTSLLPLGQFALSQSPLDTGVSLVRLVVATRITKSRMRLSRLRETLEMVLAIDTFPSLDDSLETSRSAGLFFRITSPVQDVSRASAIRTCCPKGLAVSKGNRSSHRCAAKHIENRRYGAFFFGHGYIAGASAGAGG